MADAKPQAQPVRICPMREAGLASTDAECGALIGRKPNQVLNYKRAGADRAIALACAAVLAGLPPYGDNP